MLFDMLGYPINIGDEVAFAPTGRVSSYASVSTGIVKEIKNNTIKAGAMQKFRDSDQLINLSYLRPLDDIKQESPELFI